jgi:hypothetical protein
MQNPKRQDGLMVALMQRFRQQRLPRIMVIRDHVSRGHRLSEHDRAFMEEVIQDARRNIHHVKDIPECQQLFMQLAHLYKEIMDKALANEMRS